MLIPGHMCPRVTSPTARKHTQPSAGISAGLFLPETAALHRRYKLSSCHDKNEWWKNNNGSLKIKKKKRMKDSKLTLCFDAPPQAPAESKGGNILKTKLKCCQTRCEQTHAPRPAACLFMTLHVRVSCFLIAGVFIASARWCQWE